MTSSQFIASKTRWFRVVDRTTETAPARANSPAAIEWHERKVDPDGVMDPATRRKAAECHREVYYARMSAAGVKARRAKKAARLDEDEAA